MSPAARALLCEIGAAPLMNDAVTDENRPALRELYDAGMVDMLPDPRPYQWQATHLGRRRHGEPNV